jgi:hypothetical protein
MPKFKSDKAIEEWRQRVNKTIISSRTCSLEIHLLIFHGILEQKKVTDYEKKVLK